MSIAVRSVVPRSFSAARWGRDRGARWGVLQVAVHNTAALALYARAGWTEHHRYRYLVRDLRQKF